ncbi:MAG: hypothetical protein ACLFUQ_04240 [Candidatus Izemoplasmataceae bacterium]
MKRLLIGLSLGALLGVVCIVGATLRSEEALEPVYLTAFWYNRVIIGLALGIAVPLLDIRKALLRGALIGLAVSFAFYLTTDFNDFTGFFAGIVYGVIIAYVLQLYDGKTA